MASNQMSVLKAKIDKFLEGGFIVLVTNTEWMTPVVNVPKKGSKWSYKAIIKATKKDQQPLLHIDQLLNKLCGHEMVSTCNGYTRYHQVVI